MVYYCENKSKAIVKIGEEIVHRSKFPPLEIELVPEGGCYLVYIEFSYEYQRYSEQTGWEEQWLSGGGGRELWTPLENSFRSAVVPENNGFLIEIQCKGEKVDGCGEIEWVQLTGYANERIKDAQITKFIIIEGVGDADTYLLKITNADGVEEYVKRFSEVPEYEVFCGCDLDKEIECKSDSEFGFCCIPCAEISSKINALKNKLA